MDQYLCLRVHSLLLSTHGFGGHVCVGRIKSHAFTEFVVLKLPVQLTEACGPRPKRRKFMRPSVVELSQAGASRTRR